MCISIHEMIFFPPRFCLSLSKQQHLVCCVSVCVAHCCILASCSVGGLFLDPITLRYCLARLLALSMIIFGTVHQVILLALNLTFKFFMSLLVIWPYKLNMQSVSSQKGSGLQKRFCCDLCAHTKIPCEMLVWNPKLCNLCVGFKCPLEVSHK